MVQGNVHTHHNGGTDDVFKQGTRELLVSLVDGSKPETKALRENQQCLCLMALCAYCKAAHPADHPLPRHVSDVAASRRQNPVEHRLD